jgi:excisionase family DNA binding protein
VNREWYTYTQAAAELGVCTRTVRRWVDAGDLRAFHREGTVRIHEPELRAFIERHSTDVRKPMLAAATPAPARRSSSRPWASAGSLLDLPDPLP